MKDSIFEIALELIKMAKTSVWYFFRNVSSISNSTQRFNEFLVSTARRRHRHKSLYLFFCFAVFPTKVCTKYSKHFYLQLTQKVHFHHKIDDFLNFNFLLFCTWRYEKNTLKKCPFKILLNLPNLPIRDVTPPNNRGRWILNHL